MIRAFCSYVTWLTRKKKTIRISSERRRSGYLCWWQESWLERLTWNIFAKILSLCFCGKLIVCNHVSTVNHRFSHSSSRQFHSNSDHWVAKDCNQRRHHLTLTHFTETESFPQDNKLSPQPPKYFYRHSTEITVMGGARDGINIIKLIIYMNPKVT